MSMVPEMWAKRLTDAAWSSRRDRSGCRIANRLLEDTSIAIARASVAEVRQPSRLFQLPQSAGADSCAPFVEPLQAGITLLEMVCVLAIIAALAAIALPRVGLSTSQPRLESYALEVAALLKADRLAALASGGTVSASIDARSRLVKSGSGTLMLRLPDDVVFDALLPQRCNGRPALSTISFLANGMSCGGVIKLSRDERKFEVRVNWLTGDVDVVGQTTR